MIMKIENLFDIVWTHKEFVQETIIDEQFKVLEYKMLGFDQSDATHFSYVFALMALINGKYEQISTGYANAMNKESQDSVDFRNSMFDRWMQTNWREGAEESIKSIMNYKHTYAALAEVFTIFNKYEGVTYAQISAEHDVIYAGPDPEDVSEEDRKRLSELGWYVDEHLDSFYRFT